MKHFYLTFFTVLITNFVYSQTGLETKEIVELKKQKKRVELTIKNLTDSLSKIELRIVELNSERIREKIKDSSIITLVRKGAKLKKEASLFSDIITTYIEDKELIVLGYKDEHFQVCQSNLCGYIHELWIIENDLISEFKKIKETERKNIGNSKKNLYHHKTQLGNSNKTSFVERKSQKSRTYYSGPRGGCYYINSNGNKTYVSRSLCN